MNRSTVFLIARQFWRNAFKSTSMYAMMLVAAMILSYAAYSGWRNYTVQNSIRKHYQEQARQRWENNPDKHPHRMAHYGSFAFRLKHPLSMFDFGMESFTGNAVFLEAHKQNTVNFSEASFSTGLLRFGEISMAMLLQVILPLIIFFLGFASVASERENGTLKVMLTQGAGWKEILTGKSLGLAGLSLLFFIPVAIVTLLLLLTAKDAPITADEVLRYAGTVISYWLFFQIISVVTVLISAVSNTSKDALMKVLALWLFFIILLPKTTQALGSYFYPSPSKIEFETAVEKDLVEEGDSHDPEDPHYKALKDSVLLAHHVDSVQQLPFNYSGFVMREGERLSAEIYNRHQRELLDVYRKQSSLARFTAFVNPYAAIRNISMAFSGTDFESYASFQKQAEAYRYQLAQEMNALQMEYISNAKPGPHDKPHTISRDHWKAFPDFKHRFVTTETVLRKEAWSIMALLIWSIVPVVLIFNLSKKAKAI
jgi:ABC-2 type transport system permease protein